MLHAHLITNPAAGRGAARRAADLVARAFRSQGWAVDMARTDPAVVRMRNGMPKLRGFLSYLVPIVKTFFRFQPQLFDVAAPGFRERGYMMMIEVCNGTTAGGSYRFAPDADPSDGKMDVCLIRRVSLPRFLLAIPRVMNGTHVTMPEVALIKTAKLVVRSPEEPLVVHVDGELREPGGHECTVELERGRLNVLVAR